MVEFNKISQNIKDRKAAEELGDMLFALATNELTAQQASDKMQEQLWSHLAKRISEQMGFDSSPTELHPMTPDELQKFEAGTMKFGKHKDEKIKDVPREYIEWMVDNNKPWARYVISPGFRNQAEDTHDDTTSFGAEVDPYDDDIPF